MVETSEELVEKRKKGKGWPMKRIIVCFLILTLLAISVFPVASSAASSVYYSTTTDGTLYNVGENYTVTQAAPHTIYTDDNISVEYTTTTLRSGQDLDGANYWIWRPVVVFDTSALDSKAVISAATIDIWGTTDESDTDFDINVVEGGDVHSPLTTSDFDVQWYKTTSLCNAFSTAAFATGAYNSLTLTAAGLDDILVDGYTVFGLRSSRDIAGTIPAGQEWIDIASAESAHPPKLTITYTVPSIEAPDSLDVFYASVFSNLRETGDQLYVFRSTVFYEVEPTDELPQEWYAIQLLDDDNVTIEAQTPLVAWGNSPMGIYLDNTTALAWGDDYMLRIIGTDAFGATIPTDNYVLVAADWKGSSTVKLEEWCKQTVKWLYTEDSVIEKADYVTATGDQWKLTEAAATVFLIGIPSLDIFAPDIFLAPTVIPDTPTDTAGAWKDAMYSHWGTYISGAFDDLGVGIGMSGGWIVTLFFLALAIGAVWVVREKTNEPALAIIAAMPVIGIGVFFGMPFVPAVIVCVILLFFLLWNMFARNAG